MATTPAKKAASGDAEMPGAKITTKPDANPAGASKPGAAKAHRVKADAGGGSAPSGPGPLVEKANVEVKLKDLIEKVTATTGVKKPQVRTVIEAMLKEMGDALTAMQVLNLPGFGKARVAKVAETPAGTMTIKLRRGAGAGSGGGSGGAGRKAGAEPLAEIGEDS